MESFARDVLKQNNKIKRILTKVIAKHPTLTEDLDVAMYAAIQIQKIIQRNSSGNSNPQRDESSALVIEAAEQMKLFDDNFKRLVLNINQTQTYSAWPQSIHTEVNKINRQYEGEKTEERRKKQDYSEKIKMKQSARRRLEQSESNNESVNLSQIDANILQLAQKIAQCVREESIQY